MREIIFKGLKVNFIVRRNDPNHAQRLNPDLKEHSGKDQLIVLL